MYFYYYRGSQYLTTHEPPTRSTPFRSCADSSWALAHSAHSRSRLALKPLNLKTPYLDRTPLPGSKHEGRSTGPAQRAHAASRMPAATLTV